MYDCRTTNPKSVNDLVKVLTELTQKANNETSSPETCGRKARKICIVTSECSNATREVYRTLKKGDSQFGFDLGKDVRFLCPENSEATKRILKGVRDAYGGREKCPFSKAEIEGACKRYFKSLRDAERRKEKGTKQHHVIITRRQNRRRERPERLRKALPKANYTTKCMEKVEPILAAQYMSSEESDTEGDEKVFRVRQLPWQRSKVMKMKKTLEEIYHQQLPDHLKENKRRRIISDVPSRRKPPSNCPDWVIRSDWNANEDGESENERSAREED